MPLCPFLLPPLCFFWHASPGKKTRDRSLCSSLPLSSAALLRVNIGWLALFLAKALYGDIVGNGPAREPLLSRTFGTLSPATSSISAGLRSVLYLYVFELRSRSRAEMTTLGSSTDGPGSSPPKKRSVPEGEQLSLDAIRDVVRGEIQGAFAGMNDRVAALERGLETHGDRTFQAVETISAAQTQQSLRIQELTADTKTISGRLAALEGQVKTLQSSGSTPSTMEGGRTPALVMGGWPPDTLAADVIAKANQMASDLKLELSLADAFVPGVRRGFVIIPVQAQAGETDEAFRQRVQHLIRRVNAAGINLGTKPDGTAARLWLTLSQPPERRRRAALAGKVKRVIIECGGAGIIPSIEPEWATGTVWLRGIKVASGSTVGPPTSTAAGCGWIDIGAVARSLGLTQQQVADAWEPLSAALR